MKGDMLYMMGTRDEIDACTMLLQKDHCIEVTDWEPVRLKDYIYGQSFYGIPQERHLVCLPLKIAADSPFARKSIKNCGIRPMYNATIIGIERGDLPIIAPAIETVIHRDDILWVMGTDAMVKWLIADDLLQE